MHVLLDYFNHVVSRMAMWINRTVFGWPNLFQIRRSVASVVPLRIQMMQLLRFSSLIDSPRLVIPDEDLSCRGFATGTMLLPVGFSSCTPVFRRVPCRGRRPLRA